MTDIATAAAATRDGVTLAYDQRVVAEELDVRDPRPVVHRRSSGPNACGKSTLLRALARMLKPARGDGAARRRAIIALAADQAGRAAARAAAAVARSRPTASPSPTSSPAAATRTSGCCGSGRATTSAPSREAMAATGVADLADRLVDELSGGQRQRVWIAMALAQETAAPAARRADDVPRHRPPDRGARPVRAAARRAGPHARRGAARPQPRLPLRDASWRCATASSSPRGRRGTSSPPSSWRRSSGSRAGSSPTRRPARRWWSRRRAAPSRPPGHVGRSASFSRAFASRICRTRVPGTSWSNRICIVPLPSL